MVVRVDYNLFDEADKNGYATYIVADEYVAGLKDLIGKKIAFKVFERNYNGLFIATDIRLNEDQTPVEPGTMVERAQKLMDEAKDIDGFEKAVKAYNALSENDKKDIQRKNEFDAKLAKALEEATKATEDQAKVVEKAFKDGKNPEDIAKITDKADADSERGKIVKAGLEAKKLSELESIQHRFEVAAEKDLTDFSKKDVNGTKFTSYFNNRKNAFNKLVEDKGWAPKSISKIDELVELEDLFDLSKIK